MSAPDDISPENEPGKDNLRRAQVRQHLDAAEGYLLLDMYEDALAEIGQVLEAEPYNTRALNLSGMIHLHLQDFQNAEDAFKTVLEIDPDRADIYIHLAYIYRRTEGLDSAIETMEKGLLIFDRIPESDMKKTHLPLANYNLACYYSLKKDVQNALHHLTIAIEIDKHFAKVASRDPDFDPIREDSTFLELLRRKDANPET